MDGWNLQDVLYVLGSIVGSIPECEGGREEGREERVGGMQQKERCNVFRSCII